ncbi:MAG: hypothetical protein ACTSWY_14735 [Promethearchaeota archaeon]
MFKLSKKIEEILNNLGNPLGTKELLEILKNSKFCIEERTLDVTEKTEEFLKYFGNYIKKKEFQEHIFKIIRDSYLFCEEVEDLPAIFLQMSLTNFAEIFYGFKSENIQNILGTSFKKLNPRVQILNLCLLVDSIFNNEQYRNYKKNNEEIQVSYKQKQSKIEHEIKNEIDVWIQYLKIDLKDQEELISNLKLGVKNLAELRGLDINSKSYKDLETECCEMLLCQFISESLQEELDDQEDSSPVSIH